MNLELKHLNSFTNDIIVVDGFWGSGKSIVTSMIGSLAGVEKKKVEHVYEYVCVAHGAGKMNHDAAIVFLKIYADLSQYNNLIGREVNLRWSDDSGLRNNPGSLTYLRRLFHPGGDEVATMISKENLALLIASHELLSVSDILFDAYGSRLKLIEVVRHPIHMFENVFKYLTEFERAREFTLSFEFKGEKLPWFAANWAEEYFSSSVYDRALLSIARVQGSMLETMAKFRKNNMQFLALSFESTVLNPGESLQQLENFLDRKRTKRTKRVFKQQSLPRTNISAGKATSAFSFNSGASTKEMDIYERVTTEISKNGTKSAINEYKLAIGEYNKRWPSPLADLESSWA